MQLDVFALWEFIVHSLVSRYTETGVSNRVPSDTLRLLAHPRSAPEWTDTS